MKISPAPHEKLTQEEIEDAIETLLKNTLHMKKKWSHQDVSLREFFETNEHFIFKLRRHLFPEKTTIMQVSIAELSDMMEKAYDS